MNDDMQEMVVTEDQCEQQQQIEEDDHVRHNTDQYCGRTCNNDHTCDALFLACVSSDDHHVEIPKQRNHWMDRWISGRLTRHTQKGGTSRGKIGYNSRTQNLITNMEIFFNKSCNITTMKNRDRCLISSAGVEAGGNTSLNS